MCNLIGSCTNDYELFGYDLELNAPASPKMKWVKNTDISYEIMSPETGGSFVHSAVNKYPWKMMKYSEKMKIVKNVQILQ